jgi:hypothetical protein
MSSEVGDVNGDGRPDVFVTNIHAFSVPSPTRPKIENPMLLPFEERAQGNNLLINRGNGTFVDRAEAYGGREGELARAAPNALLLVDCTSFRDDEWTAVLQRKPDVGHEPAVIYRFRPDGRLEGYALGALPIDLGFVTAPA